jgi:hypothetical protein
MSWVVSLPLSECKGLKNLLLVLSVSAVVNQSLAKASAKIQTVHEETKRLI